MEKKNCHAPEPTASTAILPNSCRSSTSSAFVPRSWILSGIYRRRKEFAYDEVWIDSACAGVRVADGRAGRRTGLPPGAHQPVSRQRPERSGDDRAPRVVGEGRGAAGAAGESRTAA